MRSRRIQLLILLAAIAIIGIIISQVFWIRKGLLINQSNFENAVVQTLTQINTELWENEGREGNPASAVLRISPRSYRVNAQTPIDLNFLDTRLRTDFANPFHKVDFTYEVFEWSSGLLVFSNSVFIGSNNNVKASKYLPNLTESTYFFKINFPQRPLIPSLMITIWAAAILILMMVIGFFTYSITVVVRQQRLSDFQNSFINNLAHEFKTPISTIAISSNVLSEPDIANDPERIKVYSNIIATENARMEGQVRTILELAGLENREVLLKKEEVDLMVLVKRAANAQVVQFQESGGHIDIKSNTNSCNVTADPVHLSNVLATLLDNASKYTVSDPDIIIDVNRKGRNVWVSIIDHGIGVPAEFRKKIFEKFFRVPTGDIHDVKGFGLGLSYVMMIVKAHHWKIEVQSELGEGSTFTLIMPISENNHE